MKKKLLVAALTVFAGMAWAREVPTQPALRTQPTAISHSFDNRNGEDNTANDTVALANNTTGLANIAVGIWRFITTQVSTTTSSWTLEPVIVSPQAVTLSILIIPCCRRIDPCVAGVNPDLVVEIRFNSEDTKTNS